MSYIGYCDDRVLFVSGLPGYEITLGQINKAVNEVENCTITLPPTNCMAHVPVKRRSIISIKHDGGEIFRGTVIDTKKDFLGNVTLQIDGALSWLGEIVRLPFAHNASERVSAYFADLLGQYAYQRMGSKKVFEIGNCTVTGTVIFDHSTECMTVFDLLSELVSEKGGYIVIRYGSDMLTIDYLAEITAAQPTIEFGKNLLSLEDMIDSNTLATRVWPIGTDGLTIGSVNDGLDYLINDEAEALYGRIDKPVQVDSDNAATVKAYGQAYLTRYSVLPDTITVTALLLSEAGAPLSAFVPGASARVISPPHGIDTVMQIASITENLVDPTKSQLILGSKTRTLTGYVQEK